MKVYYEVWINDGGWSLYTYRESYFEAMDVKKELQGNGGGYAVAIRKVFV